MRKTIEEINKDTSGAISPIGQEGPYVSRPHIKENKEENKIMMSVLIIVSSTNVQARPSGDTPSPSPKPVLRRNTSTPHTRKEIKDNSLDIEVSLDEVIEMP